MRSLKLLIVAISWFILQGANGLAQGEERSFVFLVTGKSSEGVPKEEIAKKQMAHIENFKRLAGINQLFMAGPMSDPKKFRRGIVMVASHDTATIKSYFEPDPYVSEGFMQLDIQPIGEMDGETSLDVEPNGLDELRIAIWSPANSDSPASNALKIAAAWETQLRAKTVKWNRATVVNSSRSIFDIGRKCGRLDTWLCGCDS